MNYLRKKRGSEVYTSRIHYHHFNNLIKSSYIVFPHQVGLLLCGNSWCQCPVWSHVYSSSPFSWFFDDGFELSDRRTTLVYQSSTFSLVHAEILSIHTYFSCCPLTFPVQSFRNILSRLLRLAWSWKKWAEDVILG